MMQEAQRFRQRVKRGNFRSLFGPAAAPEGIAAGRSAAQNPFSEEPSSRVFSYPNKGEEMVVGRTPFVREGPVRPGGIIPCDERSLQRDDGAGRGRSLRLAGRTWSADPRGRSMKGPNRPRGR